MKNVQIPYTLLIQLARYHVHGDKRFKEEIRAELQRKMEAVLARDYYTKYKTATTDEDEQKYKECYINQVR